MTRSLSKVQRFWKRLFDIVFSFIGLLGTWWIILLAWIISTIDTGKSGFFMQERVGLDGRVFQVIKIRTMKDIEGIETTVTTSSDPRITKSGVFFRRTKIDELPQLMNVLVGQMSFVGPRPDVPEFYQKLTEEEQLLLTVRPGVTGPATLKYRNEEQLLKDVVDPDAYNRDVIFPDKKKINIHYIANYRFSDDVRYILQTIFPGGVDNE